MSTSKQGAVACESLYAAELGSALLKQGGSAADALIATMLCVGILCSHHSGIGGGGFALVKSPDGKYEAIDCRVQAPAAANAALFENPPEALKPIAVGPLSVGVPGEIAGMHALHSKYGKLPWKAVFQPAIKLAREGYAISNDVYEKMMATFPSANHIAGFYSKYETESWLNMDPVLGRLFCDSPGSEFWKAGTIVKHEQFAKTLEKIAEEGPSAFYEGEIAEGIVRTVREQGGVLSIEDMNNYKVRYLEPLQINYKGTHTITSMPAPSSGAVLLHALNTYSNFEDVHPVQNPLTLHRTAEVLKFAYGQRTVIGDPGFVEGMLDTQKAFIKPEVGKALRAKISDTTTLADEEYNPSKLEVKEDKGTSHFTASDSDGLIITFTSTILLYWGSRIMVPESGIILNNGMEDFSVKGVANAWAYTPSPANFVEPGKRPLSSQSPYIIEGHKDGSLFAGGAAGGSRIISANFHVARNHLDYDLDAQQALTLPRIHNQLQPNSTTFETSSEPHKFVGFTEELKAALEGLGHKTEWVPLGRSTPCCIKYTVEGGWQAAGESRRFDAGGVVVDMS